MNQTVPNTEKGYLLKKEDKEMQIRGFSVPKIVILTIFLVGSTLVFYGVRIRLA